jgi:hypothetical protein
MVALMATAAWIGASAPAVARSLDDDQGDIAGGKKKKHKDGGPNEEDEESFRQRF